MSLLDRDAPPLVLLRPRSFSPQSTGTYKPHEAAGGAGEHNQGGRLRGREHDSGLPPLLLPVLFAWLPVMGTRGFGLKAQGFFGFFSRFFGL